MNGGGSNGAGSFESRYGRMRRRLFRTHVYRGLDARALHVISYRSDLHDATEMVPGYRHTL